MVTETTLKNGLVKRQSSRGMYIRNEQTGGEYSEAIDLPNEIRVKRGLVPYTYVETDRIITED